MANARTVFDAIAELLQREHEASFVSLYGKPALQLGETPFLFFLQDAAAFRLFDAPTPRHSASPRDRGSPLGEVEPDSPGCACRRLCFALEALAVVLPRARPRRRWPGRAPATDRHRSHRRAGLPRAGPRKFSSVPPSCACSGERGSRPACRDATLAPPLFPAVAGSLMSKVACFLLSAGACLALAFSPMPPTRAASTSQDQRARGRPARSPPRWRASTGSPSGGAGHAAPARFQQSIVDAMNRPAEAKPWKDYRPIFVSAQREREGIAFTASTAS